MSHVDSMVLAVLGVASSLKCLVLYLHAVEERSVASFPGSSQTHRNRMQQQTVNAMGPRDVDKPQNLTLGHSGVILHTEGSPWLTVLMTSSVVGEGENPHDGYHAHLEVDPYLRSPCHIAIYILTFFPLTHNLLHTASHSSPSHTHSDTHCGSIYCHQYVGAGHHMCCSLRSMHACAMCALHLGRTCTIHTSLHALMWPRYMFVPDGRSLSFARYMMRMAAVQYATVPLHHQILFLVQ